MTTDLKTKSGGGPDEAKYEPVPAGAWVQPVRRGYLMKCCDCGLVHSLDFRIRKGRVQLRAFRWHDVVRGGKALT